MDQNVSKITMLVGIIRSIRVLLRRLLRGRVHHAKRSMRTGASDETQSSTGESSEEAMRAGRDAAEIEGGPLNAAVDQSTPGDDDSARSAADTTSDQAGQVPREIQPVAPSSAGSEKTPSYHREKAPSEPHSSTEQPAEGHETIPNTDSDDCGSPLPDHPDGDSLDGAPKKAEASEDNPRDERPDAPEAEGKKRNRSHKSPRAIAGRRNGTKQSPSTGVDGLSFRPRPELVCRSSSDTWRWDVVLSADDECNIAKVRHGSDPLDAVNSEYSLTSLAGILTIDYEDREPIQLQLFDKMPLIFKMRKNWEGDGRSVGGITSGHFIVMAPREWKRTGSVPVVEPRPCTDANFMAHYFYANEGETEENRGGFEQYDLPLTTSGFALSGDRVFDDSDDGELFVGDPPELKLTPGVVWVRVGEEMKGGWKGENFQPSDRSLSLRDVMNGRQGRFFLRVYDVRKLLDSGEFRYLRDLREVRVNGEPYSQNTLFVPTPAGYSKTEVRFISDDGAAIRPSCDTVGTHTTVRSDGILEVAPHPDGDRISCTLPSVTGNVNIVINLPRVWWRMKQEGEEAGEWCDEPLSMTRHDFREYADKDMAIQLRLPLRLASVKVGFNEELNRTYHSQKNGNETKVEVPLLEFIDYDQIDQRLNKDALFNVQCDAEVVVLIRVSADLVPTITTFKSEPTVIDIGNAATLHWTTQNVKSDDVLVRISDGVGAVESSGSIQVMPMETTTFTLRLTAPDVGDVDEAVIVVVRARPQPGEKLFACVKRAKRAGGGWRPGKGFSRGELQKTALTDAAAAHQSISIDKRRRSTHSDNIDTIKGFIHV